MIKPLLGTGYSVPPSILWFSLSSVLRCVETQQLGSYSRQFCLWLHKGSSEKPLPAPGRRRAKNQKGFVLIQSTQHAKSYFGESFSEPLALWERQQDACLYSHCLAHSRSRWIDVITMHPAPDSRSRSEFFSFGVITDLATTSEIHMKGASSINLTSPATTVGLCQQLMSGQPLRIVLVVRKTSY